VPVHTGELVLDFYNAATKQLVFRSVVAKPIDLDGKPASRQKQVDRTAEKLLKHYPPGRNAVASIAGGMGLKSREPFPRPAGTMNNTKS
jgi:hypothetical protein